MKIENFEQKLEHYRSNYFLDPGGSNVEIFVENLNDLISNILETYVGVKIDTKISYNVDGNFEVITKNKNNESNIIKKVNDFEIIPERGAKLEEVVDKLAEYGNNCIRFNNKFIGQMHPHDNVASLLAGITGKFFNENKIAYEVSPEVSRLEKKLISTLASEFGYSNNERGIKNSKHSETNSETVPSGSVTFGGTLANLTALLVARNKLFESENIAEKGNFNIEDVIVIGSEYSHYSIEKLCGHIGIDPENYINANAKGFAMKNVIDDYKKDSLRGKLWSNARKGKKIMAVVGVAGTTETGNIDDLEGIADLLIEFNEEFGYKPHFHVDAAHGGGYIFHEDFNIKDGKFKGIQYADSITIDPHKMLYTPYSAGIILFKDKKDHDLLKHPASYLFKDDGKPNLGESSVEGSMPTEGTLQTVYSLYALGREGYQVIHQHTLNLTKYLKDRLFENSNFQILNEPEMNLLSFRYCNEDLNDVENDAVNKLAQQRLYDQGKVYISNERIKIYENNKKKEAEAFRSVLMHPWTTTDNIDDILYHLEESINFVVEDLENHRI